MRQTGLSSFLISAGALLVYASAALWVRQTTLGHVQTALVSGAKIGLGLGIIAVVCLVLEHFAASNSSLNAIRGGSMWGLMFLSFGADGSAAYQKSGSLGLAVMSSLWSSLVSTIWMIAGGFTLALLFMPQMMQILAPAYAQSGIAYPQAFVIEHTLSASTMHLLLVPVVATIFGLIGGCAAAALAHIRQSVVISLGVLELLFFVGGLASLRLASSLERPARPPFVMAGLLALGIALACAHPIWMVVRRPALSSQGRLN